MGKTIKEERKELLHVLGKRLFYMAISSSGRRRETIPRKGNTGTGFAFRKRVTPAGRVNEFSGA